MSQKSDSKSSQGSQNSSSGTDSRESSSYLCGLLRPSSGSGGVKNIAGLTYIYGNTSQAFLDGKYAGLQCTTMALTAIISNDLCPRWTPRRINAVLREGDRLHTFLRDGMKLSRVPDGKIAVEDISHVGYVGIGSVFGVQPFIKLKQECQNVFTSKFEGYEDFYTIGEFIQFWKPVYSRHVGFIITLGESSYGIILRPSGKVYLFDSHGHLRLHGDLIKEKAGLLKFHSIRALEEFLIQMYGEGRHAAMAPVSVTFHPRVEEKKRKAKLKEKALKMGYTPYIPEVKVKKVEQPRATESTGTTESSESTETTESSTESNTESSSEGIVSTEEITVDPSPFIGMMGGGD